MTRVSESTESCVFFIIFISAFGKVERRGVRELIRSAF